MRLAKRGIENSPDAGVVRNRRAPRSSTIWTWAPAMSSPASATPFPFRSRYARHATVSEVATRSMSLRVLEEKVTDAKYAPARLNDSRSYVPAGRKARYCPSVSVWSHNSPDEPAKATSACGFWTPGVGSFTVPFTRTPSRNIASSRAVAPDDTSTSPKVAYRRDPS